MKINFSLPNFEKMDISNIINYLDIPEKQKCTIIGNFGNGNIGDEILLLSTIEGLEKTKQEVSVVIRSKTEVKSNKDVSYITPSLIGLLSLLRTNVLIIGPGGLFGKDIGPFARFIPIVSIILKLMGKKIIFYGFGIYENTPKSIQWLTTVACYFADYVSVRDEHSLQLLCKSELIKKKVHLILDPAFYLNITMNREKRSDTKIRIGISLRFIEQDQLRKNIIEYFSKIKKIKRNFTFVPLNFYNEPNLSVRHPQPSDKRMIELIKEKMKSPDFCNESEQIESIESILKKYSTLDAVIASRFHAQILAVIYEIPLLSIGYSPKNLFSKHYKKATYIDENRLKYEDLEKFLLTIEKKA